MHGRHPAASASTAIAAVALLGLCGTPLGPPPAQAQIPTPSEYELKAACLAQFPKFITWPAKAFTSDTAAIVIGVLGDDPFGKALDALVRGETVQDRPLVTRRSRRLEDLQHCHLLFISRSEKPRLARLLHQLRGSSVVTVGDSERFAQQGGVINLTLRGNKVALEVNPAIAEAGGVKISSKLLNLATVIGSTRNRGHE